MPRTKRLNRIYVSSRMKARLGLLEGTRSVLIEAPSGYGKTTLVQHLLQQHPLKGTVQVRHVCIEETPAAAWRRFCRRIESLDEHAGRLLFSLGPPTEETAGEAADLLREISPSAPSCLVLDDFHHLAPLAPVSVWNAFLEHESSLLTLVLVTRTLETGVMPYEKSGHLRIDIEDLRLTNDESREYFAKAGIHLDDEEAEGLHQRAEGWIIALSLHLRHWDDKGFFAPASSIDGLLRDLFWSRIDDDGQDLLLRLSPFDYLTAAQVASDDDQTVSAVTMNALRQNSLLRFDVDSGLYYPHSTLLEFIRARFAELPKARQDSIFMAAGDWCAANDERDAALEFYYRVRAFEKFLSLDLSFLRGLESSRLPHKLDVSHLEILRDVASNCTKEMKIRYPVSYIQLAFEFFGQGGYAEFVAMCAEMSELVETEIPEEDRDYLRGELKLLEAFSRFNSISEMGERMSRAAALTGGKTALVGPGNSWTVGNVSVGFMFHSEVGRLDEKVVEMEKYLPCYIGMTNGHGSGGIELMAADVLLLKGQADMAEILGHSARQKAEQHAQAILLISVEFLFARLSVIRGDIAAYAAALENMERIANRYPQSPNRFAKDLAQAFLLTLLHRTDDVPEWLRLGSAEFFSRRLFSQAVPFANLCRGAYLLLVGQPQVFLGESAAAASLAKVHGYALALIYHHIHKSAAWSMHGNPEEAIKSLQEALDMALPDGVILPFAENHPLIEEPFQALLSSLESDHPSLEHLASVQALASQMEAGRLLIVDKLYATGRSLGLTRREYEIANLAANGFSAGEVSRKLHISINTVKTHLKSVYAKTGSTSRRSLKKILGL